MRRRRGRPLDGWLIIDKPAGMTSTDVVNRVRRGFDAQKAGHGGTLDPLATGVLPIAFGAATKTVPYVMDGTKLYRFTLRFGDARDTDDADGADHRHQPRPADGNDAAARGPAWFPAATIMQVPPAYSAIKVAGERAYDMARDGRARRTCRRARPGWIGFTLIEPAGCRHGGVRSAIRQGRLHAQSLARDLAGGVRRAGPHRRPAPAAGGAVHGSRIDSAGQMSRGTADTPPTSPDLLLPVATALADIPALALTERRGRLPVTQGQAISLVDLMGQDSR